MSWVTTVPQRKEPERLRLVAAAGKVARALDDYAAARDGRFVVFGSYVTGRMRCDSDLDVLVDFPTGFVAEACDFVEAVCSRHRIRPDVRDTSYGQKDFIEHAIATGIWLAGTQTAAASLWAKNTP